METKFITNNKGEKISAILSIKKYNEMKEKIEELEDINLYYEAKNDKTPPKLASDVFARIESKRSLRDGNQG